MRVQVKRRKVKDNRIMCIKFFFVIISCKFYKACCSLRSIIKSD
jgi:hypothetical protein